MPEFPRDLLPGVAGFLDTPQRATFAQVSKACNKAASVLALKDLHTCWRCKKTSLSNKTQGSLQDEHTVVMETYCSNCGHIPDMFQFRDGLVEDQVAKITSAMVRFSS
jgi:hypothetical protein